MGARSVELIALGPPPVDPYAPAAGAWALARASAERGNSVRVLYPEGLPGGPAPAGVVATAVPVPLRRPGAPSEDAEFAALAGRGIRSGADLVLRDPVGLGPLGVRGRSSPRLVGFARSIELAAFDRERGGYPSASFVDRLDGWRDRRTLRRLERLALEEPDAVFCDDPGVAVALASEYHLPPERLRPTAPPVPYLANPPSRDRARAAFGIPTDVPVVVVPAAVPSPEVSGVEKAREAFRRVRPFFPGLRMIVVGAPGPTDPGVVTLPGRDAEAFAAAFAAADVAMIVPQTSGFDPGAVFASRAGCATIVGATLTWPAAPAGAVRTVPGDDPGDLASALAELIADPGAARELATKGKELAEAYRPERILDQVDAVWGGSAASR